MAKIKVAKNPSLDPTLPKVELRIGERTYLLVFTFGALAIAQAKLREQGVEVNLLHALDLQSLDATRVVPLLFAALVMHQPALTYDEACDLVTLKNLGEVFSGLLKAYEASLAEPDEDANQVPLAQAE